MVSGIPSVLAQAAVGSAFGARDLAGLVFIAVAITLIWVGFFHRPPSGPPEPPPPPPA